MEYFTDSRSDRIAELCSTALVLTVVRIQRAVSVNDASPMAITLCENVCAGNKIFISMKNQS